MDGGINMSKTLSNLRAQTRTYLDEATTADWTDPEIDREVNVRYLELYTAAVTVFEDYYSVKATTDTFADIEEYTLPTDVYKIRRIEINYNASDSNSIPSRARPASMDSVLRDLGNSAQGITVYRNPSYYIRGNIFGIIPAPTRDGDEAITMWYVKQISELSAASDEIDIPFEDRYANLIALGASATLLRKGQQEEAVASQYLAEFANGIEKMQEELKDRIADDNYKSIIDTVGDDVDFASGGA